MDSFGASEYEQETIKRALEGDHMAGIEALKLCCSGLYGGVLSTPLAYYLADRLGDVLEGIKPDRALCIAKSPGKPADQFPEWQQRLGALAALLTQRGYTPKAIAVAMCEARSKIEDKSLEESEAHRIRSKYRPMQSIDEAMLQHLAESYWEILEEYPTLK